MDLRVSQVQQDVDSEGAAVALRGLAKPGYDVRRRVDVRDDGRLLETSGRVIVGSFTLSLHFSEPIGELLYIHWKSFDQFLSGSLLGSAMLQRPIGLTPSWSALA